MKILIVEDEIFLQESVLQFLKKEKYHCETATSYYQAEDLISSYEYDCVLLDINLPGGIGLDLIKPIKTRAFETAIIIISARDSVNDRITGLDLGADDYLTKPFHLSELNARLKAVLRRKKFKGSNIQHFNEISINFDAHEVRVNDKVVIFTPKEYELLEYFLTNVNRVLSKSSICEYLLGEQSDWIDSFDLVYTHLKNVRKKLTQAGAKDYIQTIYGTGYQFVI